MERLKQSKLGIMSFILAFVPIIYVVIQTIIDLSTPVNTGIDKGLAISYFIMNLTFAISLVSFVLGIIAITRKGYKKVLPISSVIISGLVLLVPIISSIKSMIKILSL